MNSFPGGKFCAIHNGSIHCHGEDGTLGRGVLSLYEDKRGNLWASGQKGLWRWKPGAPKFYPLPGEVNGIQSLAEDSDGALLIGMRDEIMRLVDGKPEPYPLPGLVRQRPFHSLLRDRHCGLWIGTIGRGLIHVRHGRTDIFAQSDGLSGDEVGTLFEDREGSIWVATTSGLDRFRDFAVAFSVKQGLSNAVVGSVLAARDGSILLNTGSGLNRWSNGQFTIYGSTAQAQQSENAPHSLFRMIAGEFGLSRLASLDIWRMIGLFP